MYEAKDKVIIVTGGADGIGAEVVRLFLEEEPKFVAFLDVDVEKGKALENELTAKHGAAKVKFYKCDITDSEDLNYCYDDILKTFNYIDVLVNNAATLNDENFKKSVALNVTAVMENSFKAYGMMRKDRGGKGGTIINIASIAAILNIPYAPVYCATKSAVLQFSLCLGADDRYSISGVRVVTVCFGATDTSIFGLDKARFMDKESHAEFYKHFHTYPMQSPKSAARGLIEAYKRGGCASTWLVTSDQPAQDITGDVTQGYQNMSKAYTSS